MKHGHNTVIINDHIIELNISEFDPRWIGRGALNSQTRTWVMNIPKNASNSIGRLIAPGNRPRASWQTEVLLKNLQQPDDQYIVVLRNPIDRFCGSLAQHYVIRLEHGSTLAEIHSEIDSLAWCEDLFDDMHIWPQFTYLHGIPLANTTWFTLENIHELPDHLGITLEIGQWNASDDNETLGVTKKRIRTILDTNPNVKSHVESYYEKDIEMITNILGKLPKK